MKKFRVLSAAVALLLSACASSGPGDNNVSNVNDICAIYRDNPHWAQAVRRAGGKWDAPEEVKMAIIWRESAFKPEARPPYRTLFGIPTGKRRSSAYGYSQALDGTWRWYQQDTGHGGAARNRFVDAIDFVGWYMAKTRDVAGVPTWNAFHQYLAYHEGQQGYLNGAWRNKRFVQRAAADVAEQAARYRQQLQRCRG